MRDFADSIHVVTSNIPVTLTNDSTAQVGAIIDTEGYGSCTFVITAGVMTDANVTVAATLEHGDAANLADTAAVTDADLHGTLAKAALAFGDDSEPRKLGYKGNKRYLRLTLTPTGNDAGALPIAAVAILGRPRSVPTANPPL